jgi:hypothetical protein
MRSPFARYIGIAVLTAICGVVVALGADEDIPPFDVAEWLSMPDHMDFPWKVRIPAKSSWVNLQQRYVTGVSATIDGGDLEDTTNKRVLHFVLKVATSDNRWLPGYSYTRASIPSGVDRFHEIQYINRLYLRPGHYTVALIVYDPAFKQGNIYRKNVEVSRLKNDPLPELDRNMPDVEFIGTDQMLGQGKEWLPVKNNRYLCIDIVVNTSVDKPYSQYSSSVLQASSVLSHLELSKGSVRVTLLDALRMKTIFNRVDAVDFDWQQAIEVFKDQERAVIDIGTLGLQTQASAYLLDEFQKILEDSACGPGAESPLKIVIVVSGGWLKFAKDTRIHQIEPQDPDAVRFFYFNTYTYGESVGDQLYKMLKRTKPRRFLFDDPLFSRDPLLFRKALASLISDLEKLKQ